MPLQQVHLGIVTGLPNLQSFEHCRLQFAHGRQAAEWFAAVDAYPVVLDVLNWRSPIQAFRDLMQGISERAQATIH